MATTVAGDDPETAANRAQANTAGESRDRRDQCPTMLVAKAIMRRATPPWVRKLPARMKKGIAMISNFSMPVKSFRATDSIGTWVMVKRKVSTVRPRAMDIGMPVSIKAKENAEDDLGVSLASRTVGEAVVIFSCWRRLFDAIDMAVIVMRQVAGPDEIHHDLKKAEAHE
jgi:hypothetical protein